MIAATPPECAVFSQADPVGSAPSPLEYSLREACLPELNARLRAEGFEPPGKGLAAWVRLARVVQVDPAKVTVDELVEEACAWAERVRVTERIRMQVVGPGPAEAVLHHGGTTPSPAAVIGGTGGSGWMWRGGGICFTCREIMAAGCGIGLRSWRFRQDCLTAWRDRSWPGMGS